MWGGASCKPRTPPRRVRPLRRAPTSGTSQPFWLSFRDIVHAMALPKAAGQIVHITVPHCKYSTRPVWSLPVAVRQSAPAEVAGAQILVHVRASSERGKLFYLQLELSYLQLSFFAYSPLRPLLDAPCHCKQKSSNCK